MKKFNKSSIVIALAVSMVFGFSGPITVDAATTPSLGIADTFGVLASTYTRIGGLTVITGDLGKTGAAGGVGTHTVSGTTYTAVNATYTQAGTDQGSALSTGLATQTCTYNFPAGAIDLATNTTHGPIGVYTPGVYCVTGAASIGTAGITLNGAGTYIFRITGALTSADNSTVTLSNGASSCDVFWTPVEATTLGANTTFVGTVIDDAGIIVGSTTAWNGRALAFGGTVQTDTNTISTSCVSAALVTEKVADNTITVIKQVINDNGGTALYSDFPLFVNGNLVTSGQSKAFAPGMYTITETNLPGYTRTFSGNCDVNGRINHGGINTHNDICTVINNDIGAPVVAPIAPIIDIVKVPSPLALPAGPGLVTYTFTVKNIGTVSMTDVTVIDDSCSPAIRALNGDINSNAKLDVGETWVYTCATTLSKTHTNTVVATGYANGLSSIDVATATVVVGAPIVSPLIHVTKVPSPSSLAAGGGLVTYTYTVTNPGTEPLSTVSITDDKCTGLPGRVVGHPGDLNKNDVLESNETWTFICKSKLTKTTTNTAIASGTANGLVATDFALATVVVAIPKLPNTGVAFEENSIQIAVIIGVLIASLLVIILRKKQIV